MQEEHSTLRDPATRGEAPVPSRAIVRRREPTKPGDLTPVQQLAMQRLVAGGSIAQAAEAARVDRRTVYRWLQADPLFASAYAAWQRETIASGRARVLAMTDLALDTVHNAMLQGDVRAALEVAKATGAMDAPKPGTTDPAYFRHRQKHRNRARKETIESARRREWLDRPQNNPHRAAHCEHMIDGYLRDRRDALRHETPAQRSQRLADQPHRHRNYDPLTLRLLATMDAELAAAPPGDAPADAAPAPNAASSPDASPTDRAGAESSAHPPAPAADAPPDAAATDRAIEPNATDTPTPGVVTTDVPPDPSSRANPDTSPVPPAQAAAFPGARPAQTDPPEPPPASAHRRAASIQAIPYDGSDEFDDEPGWTRLI
jgi:hypothetical protein